jgi:predicted ATPase
MSFSRNIGFPKLSPNQLQQLELDLWQVYLDNVLDRMLSYHQTENRSEAHPSEPASRSDKMSDVAAPLKTYFSDIWNLFVDKKAPLPNSIEPFKQKIKGIFLNVGTSKRWGNLCAFLEYTIEEMESLVSEADEQTFITEMTTVLIEYEAGYRLVDGKLEVDKSLQKFENLEQLIDNQLFIQSLHLKNISLFKDLEIRFDRGKSVTCFVGGNGSGKTTLLRAIAVGLIGATNFKPEALNLLAIREAKKDKLYQKEGSIEIQYLFHGEQTKSQVHFRAIDLDRRFKIKNGNGESRFLMNANDDSLKTLILGFSQQTGSIPSTPLNGLKPKIQDVEALILNKPDARFEEVSVWLQKLLLAPAEADRVEHQGLIERIFKVINQVTEAGLELMSYKDIYVKTKENPEGIPIDLLSQGYRNVLAWFGFFMKRLWEYGQSLAFRVDDFTKLPALCLIDEIDTYLHPKWQKNILSTLVDTFPNVQFIVTTHSPLVITHLKNTNDTVAIYQITPNRAEKIRASGQDIRTALLLHFGVERRPLFYQAQIDDLFLNFEKWEARQKGVTLASLEKQLNELVKILGENDPDVETATCILEALKIPID